VIPQDQELDREREYSPSSCIGGNYQPHIEQYQLRSQAAKALPHISTAAYDLFLPDSHVLPCEVGGMSQSDRGVNACPPLLIFIHGGYWQELSKADSLFAAPDCINAGIAFAAIEYTLAPQASVADIVQECRAAVANLRANASQLGFDADRIYVAGSSAGAHLAAMVALTEPVAGVILVSGIYDLSPLMGTSINDALGLDESNYKAVSPASLTGRGFPSTIVCWGEIETSEFKRQSNAYADLLLGQGDALGDKVQRFEVPAKNHFDIILDLANLASQLGQATHALLQSTNPAHR
jgi:arylformamidase